METFVLLPFFLFSRISPDANTWHHGPEYTFVADANMSTVRGRSIVDFTIHQVYTTLKCRPRLDSNSLHCQFGTVNMTVHKEKSEIREMDDSWFQAPFDINFDRRGIQSLVVHKEIDHWFLDMIRAFVSQMNFGVGLLHKPDGVFKAKEKSYVGRCEAFVNITHKVQNENVAPEKKDYEIVPMTGLQKKQGETLVVEKSKNLEICGNKRNYVLSGEENRMGIETKMFSSHSRIEISDTSFNSYTENLVDIVTTGVNLSFIEKISLNLTSVLPAKEALEPFSEPTKTVSLYVYDKN